MQPRICREEKRKMLSSEFQKPPIIWVRRGLKEVFLLLGERKLQCAGGGKAFIVESSIKSYHAGEREETG